MASRRATIFLTAKDLERSRRFYTEDLGLQESSAASDHVAYGVGGTRLVIHREIPPEEMARWGLPPVQEPRGSGVTITLRAEDPDSLFRRLQARKVPVLLPPRDAPWGVRLLLLQDPDGYTLEVNRPLLP